MMGRRDQKLNSQEIFTLLASAYVHDVGMQYGKDTTLTLMDVREKHHLLSEEMIRGSVEKPLEYPNLGIPPLYVDEIAKVSKGHRRTNLYTSEYDSVWKGGEEIRLRLLAALLSLADDLDITFERVKMENLKLKTVPQESRVHWWRCHYVDGVKIEKGRIRIHYKFPSEEYKELVPPSIEEQLETNMINLRDILWTNGIRLYLEQSKFEFPSSSKIPMSVEDLNFLRGKQAGVMEKIRARIKQEASDFLRKAWETIGLNCKYRHYDITLEWSKEWVDVLEGKITYDATIRNETDDSKLLFPDGKVSDGHTTVPKPLLPKSQITAEDVVSFEGLRVDDKDVCFDKNIGYVDPKNKEKGITRTILCREPISPRSTHRTSCLEKFLFDRIDTFARRFKYLSIGVVEVHVHHPGITVDILWYSSPESDLRTAKTVVSPNYIIFTASGKFMPSDGFLLSWTG